MSRHRRAFARPATRAIQRIILSSTLLRWVRVVQIVIVAASLPLLIVAGDDLVRAVEIVGGNVLLNIGVGALAAWRQAVNDVDVSGDSEGDGEGDGEGGDGLVIT